MTGPGDDRRGLRAHDVHQGLHGSDLDRESGSLARDLEATQLIGRAAALAAWIKGQDVVEDAQKLNELASAQLDISWNAFDRVIEILEERGFVYRVVRDKHRIVKFYEDVPASHEAMYSTLGAAWRDEAPTEIESALLGVVDDLSLGPRRRDELDVDPTALEAVLSLGREAEAVRSIQAGEAELLFSPFFGFEQPEILVEIMAELDLERIRHAFEVVRGYQGQPLSLGPDGPALASLVGSGLMAGPALERPDHTLETFAIAPYGLPSDLRTVKRPVLDKAQAVIAAVRMGSHFGGATSLSNPVALLRKLADPDRMINAHSSNERQYAALHNMGVVRFEPSGSWQRVQLIPDKHGDNQAAVRLAIDLLTVGEASSLKEYRDRDAASLLVPGHYRTAIQGSRAARRQKQIPAAEMRLIVETAMGRRHFD